MSKIKVVHHSKYIGYSGTDKAAQLFTQYLYDSAEYSPYIIYRDCIDSPMYGTERLNLMKGLIGEERVIPYKWKHNAHDDFEEVIKGIKPDIVHVHNAGVEEYPCYKSIYPNAKWINHNIFGYTDAAKHVDETIYISDYIRKVAMDIRNGSDGYVLENPIEKPLYERKWSYQYYIDLIGLPTDAILLGRVGRPDNFDGIALKAFKVIEEFALKNNIYYLVVNACDGWRSLADKLSIKNVIFLDPIYNNDDLSKFYSAIDIFAHSRSDGECNPTAILEAMMHGCVPVSHVSKAYNGHIDVMSNCGFVVPVDDYVAYADVLKNLILDRDLWQSLSEASIKRAMQNEASLIVDKLKNIYKEIA